MTFPSGIPALGDLHPGAHIGQFYSDQRDLLEALVPYFAAGLRQLERCIRVASEPLGAAEARAALAAVVADLAEREAAGQIQIVDYTDWYTRAGTAGVHDVIEGWLSAEEEALAAGFRGLRISGNTSWLPRDEWPAFAEYEARARCLPWPQDRGAVQLLAGELRLARGRRRVAQPLVIARARIARLGGRVRRDGRARDARRRIRVRAGCMRGQQGRRGLRRRLRPTRACRSRWRAGCEQIAGSVHAWFADEHDRALIEKLRVAGGRTADEPPAVPPRDGRLAGTSIVLTGGLGSLSREEATRLAQGAGARVVSSVSKKTDFVVAGENPGSKLVKAEQLGVEVIDETEFLKRLGPI